MTTEKVFIGYTGQNIFGEFLLGTKPNIWGRPLEARNVFSSLEKIKKVMPQGGRQGIYKVYRVGNGLELELN
jgi:hypothetical protein